MREKCLIDDCDRLEDRRGFCNKHYRRYLKYGDAEYSPYERAPKGAPQKFIEEALSQDTSDCIIWPYGKDSDGYGWFTPDGGKQTAVHRHVCEKEHGDPLPGDHAAHSCATPACVNKKHLRWATHHENMQDKVKK